MNLLLLQAGQRPTDPIPAPSIEWSAFAPELLLVGAALLLLGLAAAGTYRFPIAISGAVAAAGVGTWLLVREGGDALVVPGIVAVAFGAGVVAAVVRYERRPGLADAWIAGAALLGALALTAWQWSDVLVDGPRLAMTGAIALDGVAVFTRGIVLVTALLVLPIGYGYLNDRGVHRAEFEPLLLLCVVGMTVLAAAADLLTVFIALELLSFSLYILVGFARRDRRSQEASIKYFLIGAVASAILIYGIALLYVATGSIDLDTIGTALAVVTTPVRVAFLGVALVTVGLAFKVAAVPFHVWTPDVYQGSPTNITAFMAAATKAAGFAVVLRVFTIAFGALESTWVPILAVIAAATMLLGAFGALVQRDVKRILAYSSIAHVGYALVGVLSASERGVASTLWFLLTYAVTAVGAFGCVIAIERRRRGEVALVDLRGLGRTSPALAIVLALCLLSLAGIPGTAGFMGKFAVFTAGAQAGLDWLVVVGVLSSAIAAFYYLRLMGLMFLEDPPEDAPETVMTTGLLVGVAAAAAMVTVLGILPGTFLDLAERAASLAR